MNVGELLKVLRARDIHVWAEGDGLRVSAPRGALDADLQSAMARLKPELGVEVPHRAVTNFLESMRRRLDDFFDLGGHSLQATRVIAHIKERCGVDLPLKAFFEAPQLADLADRVSALQWAVQGRGEAIEGATDREEVEI